MHRGRPSIELQSAIEWLKEELRRGLDYISYDRAVKDKPCSIRTLKRAKKLLGLKSTRIGSTYYWHKPATTVAKTDILADQIYEQTRPKYVQPSPNTESGHKSGHGGRIELDQEPISNTADLIYLCESMRNENKTLAECLAEVISSDQMYPAPIPYTLEYLKSIVNHVYNGARLLTELNPNKEQY